jgi:ABC-type transport system involved in multi-copper enzyme maturation permease subunit
MMIIALIITLMIALVIGFALLLTLVYPPRENLMNALFQRASYLSGACLIGSAIMLCVTSGGGAIAAMLTSAVVFGLTIRI